MGVDGSNADATTEIWRGVSTFEFWERGEAAIVDVCIVDTDQRSYQDKAPETVLVTHKTSKKAKYLAPCHKAQNYFFPLVVLVDGVMVKKHKAAIKRLAALLSQK